MNQIFTIYSVLFIATALLSFFVAFLAWQRRLVKGAQELALLTIAAGFWAFWIIFETASPTMAGKIFWAKLEYFGAVSTPIFYLIFVFRFTGKDKFITRKFILSLFTIPAITLALAITNEYHHLVWSGFSAISPNSNMMEFHHGIWFWFGYMGYNYLILLMATIFLFNFIIRHTRTFFFQAWVVFMAGLCPWAASIVYLAGINPVPGLDLVPVSMILSATLLFYAILYSRFLDLAPIARETLVETLPDGILALDANNRIQDINEAAISCLGIMSKHIIGLPAGSAEVANPTLLNASINQSQVDQIEITTGSVVKTFRIIKQPIKTQPGSRLVVIRDISDQVARQKEIRDGEQRYRSMVTMFRLMADNMPDLIWAKDLDKNFIFTNKAVCEKLISAVSTDEPVGKSDMFFAERERKKYPEDPHWYTFGELCQDSDQVVINSQKPERFDEYGNVKGKFLFLDVRKAPIMNENGVMIGVVGSARDVTLQKKTETEISRKDKLLDSIAKATALLVHGENFDESISGALEIIGKGTEANRVYIFTNHTDSETQQPLMSQSHEWTDGSAEPQINNPNLQNVPYSMLDERLYPALASGAVLMGIVSHFPLPGRAMLESQGIKSILITPVLIDKTLWGFIGFDDCTKEREWSPTEEKILAAAANTIGAAYLRKKNQDELVAAKEKAELSDRLKSTFLANMSHEIRTPMNAITGFSGLLIEPDISADDRKLFANIIQSRSDDLMRIIDDIMEISRIESGNATIIRDEVNLRSLLSEIELVIARKTERLNKSHLPIFCELPATAEEVPFISDPFIIKQVFTNLLDNAIKFTDAGMIRYGYMPPANEVITCFVADTGVGITPENQSLIFEHFRQADMQNPHQYGGTGLGLSICKGSLALLGGDIWVESVPGTGSTFYFTLPCISPRPAGTPSIPEQPRETGGGPASEGALPLAVPGKKILLIEDEETNMRLLTAIASRTGADLVCAINGKEVRQQYARLCTFNLVLLDIRLPDANGWDLAREIKALCPGLPVIAQTAYAMSGDREKSLAAGCDDYIPKPINKEQLLKMIAKYLV